MKALVKAKPEVGIWMQDVPKPEFGPNDLLIKIRKTAICGTDVHIYNWDDWAQETIPVPPSSRGGIVGGVAAGLVLAVEVLFSLVGGGLRWAFADRESASNAPVIQLGRVVLLLTVLFSTGALLLFAISNLIS